MDIAQLWNALNELDLASGGAGAKRIVSISYGEDRIVLPVTPRKYQAQLSQNNKIVEILDFGEMLVFGNTKLHRLKFSSFFPALSHNYPFVVGDRYSPQEFMELLNAWKINQCPVRVIITDSLVNENFAIMNIDFDERDGTRDIYYDIDLVEVKEWNVPESNYTRQVNSITGLRDRPGIRTASSINSYIEANAKDLIELSKVLGGGSANAWQVAGAIGQVSGNQSIADVANIGLAVSTGGWAAVANSKVIGSALNVLSDPLGTVKNVGKFAVNTVTNVVKSVIKNPIKAVFKGVGGVFGGGGCFITSAVCESFDKPDDCAELTAFRYFRDNWLINQPDGQQLIDEYYAVAPEIVRRINERADSAEIYLEIWVEYLDPCYDLIQRGEYLACKQKYVEMVRRLQREFKS